MAVRNYGSKLDSTEENFLDDDGANVDGAKTCFRSHEKIFAGAKIFEKLDRLDAIDFVKELSKWELSSRFLSRLKFENFARHFWVNSADRPRI